MISLFSAFRGLSLAREPLKQTLKSALPTRQAPGTSFGQTRSILFAPRQRKFKRAHKGRVPVRTGGSYKGTTISYGDFGIRVLDGSRLTAKQLQSSHDAIKRAIKSVKGAQVYMRVFPDVPVCVKGNEVKMGKGKGTFEYWACRVPVGKVIFEVGGGNIRPEVAKAALRLASHKLPVKTEFITKDSPPRIGYVGLTPEEYEKLGPTRILGPNITAASQI